MPPATPANAPAWDRVGQYVRQRRAELDITQDDLGVSKAVASALENGKQTSYSARSLARVCRALGWTPDSIDRVLAGGEPQVSPVGDGHPALGYQVDPDVASAILELQTRVSGIEAELAELRAARTASAEFSEELRRREGRRPATAGTKRHRAAG